MAYDDLREWISALDSAGELSASSHEADPMLEIAEITDRVSKSSGVPRARLARAGPRCFSKT